MTAAIAPGPGKRLGVFAFAAAIGFAILCGLGVWQLQRLAGKTELIGQVETRIALPPIAAPGPGDWPALDFGDADYLPVVLQGAFRHDAEAHVFVSLTAPHGPLGGSGYFVLTPLLTAEGWWVIVNRGFVPEDGKDPATRSEGQREGPVEIVGLLRRPQGRNAFTPADDIAGNVWFTRDPASVGAAFGIPAVALAPYYVDAAYDAAAPGGLPQGGETTITFANNHLQYALTWFGLALCLAAVAIARMRSASKGARMSP